LRVFVDNWRWQDVPFYLRSGKAMAEKRSEIVISFTCPPHLMFHLKPGEDLLPNIISICIQPDEGIHLRFETKVPDSMEEMQSVDMEFTYKSTFRNRAIPSAYERLLLDALNGDAALFTRSDEIEASWTFIDPILQGWDSPHAPPLLKYRRGSWGPPEAVKLLQPDCDAWRLGCGQHADKPPAP
jgi:glucose-6-phosphate 1-dehydrogenase